jgi:TnsA endonuclease N terminal/TnsA endonuclease C terminal
MVGITKWTDKKIEEMRAQGFGSGFGTDYRPWLDRLSFSSRGRCRSTGVSPKTGRVHELFSDVEYNFFLCLERDRSVVDIREQFPLDRNVTQEVARVLDIPHPIYPRTETVTVMTVDFMVTKFIKREKQFVAFNIKTASEMEDKRSVAKLEIQRAALEMMGIPHKLVLDTMMSRDLISKLEWIRRPSIAGNETVPYPEYWNEMESTFVHAFSAAPSGLTLTEFCKRLDSTSGLPAGTGLTIGRRLMFSRTLEPDLHACSIPDSKLSTFKMFAQTGRLRAIGGGA